MKVVVVANNYVDVSVQNPKSWYLIADSAVTNTGKPFYMPDDKGRVTVSVAGAVKICRLGKFIAPKFASRYYIEYAPCIHFNLTEYQKKLRSLSLPEDPARNFDRSLFVGDFMPYDSLSEIEMLLNGEKVSSFRFDRLHQPLDEVVSEISVLNTLKMGDLLLPGIGEEIFIKQGDLIEVSVNGIKSFHVKVK